MTVQRRESVDHPVDRLFCIVALRGRKATAGLRQIFDQHEILVLIIVGPARPDRPWHTDRNLCSDLRVEAGFASAHIGEGHHLTLGGVRRCKFSEECRRRVALGVPADPQLDASGRSTMGVDDFDGLGDGTGISSGYGLRQPLGCDRFDGVWNGDEIGQNGIFSSGAVSFQRADQTFAQFVCVTRPARRDEIVIGDREALVVGRWLWALLEFGRVTDGSADLVLYVFGVGSKMAPKGPHGHPEAGSFEHFGQRCDSPSMKN